MEIVEIYCAIVLIITIICCASVSIKHNNDMKDPEKFRKRVDEEIRAMEGKNPFVSGYKAEIELMQDQVLREEGIEGYQRMIKDGFLDEKGRVRYK